LILKAPAKVNLHLEIKGKRPDGYHEILSVVQCIPLYDYIQIRSLKKKHALRVVCDPPLPARPNIASLAAASFRNACRIDDGIEVIIEKKIPVGAGLAGGSSDAAAVLTGLNRLFGSVLKPGQLHDLASQIGSDVPLFFGAPAALMSGRGEKITDLGARQDFELVLVYPGFPISTQDAYQWFDQDTESLPTASFDPADLRLLYEKKRVDSWDFFNSFQNVVERRFPMIKRITEILRSSGAHIAAVTGSGSSVFGVFTDGKAARSARDTLGRAYPHVWMLVPLKDDPFAD
jgi:4-diphosphocytidyl-2-C-methyl-D-erythritol kinase